MEGTNSVIHVEDLTMAYRETPVLWDIDLDVPEHVRCAIVPVPVSVVLFSV